MPYRTALGWLTVQSPVGFKGEGRSGPIPSLVSAFPKYDAFQAEFGYLSVKGGYLSV
jgi:hypothetical protein